MVNIMYSNNDFRSYALYHHGILGMKWGRKNGPPYPLGASDHSASEKKAGWRDSLEKTPKSSSDDSTNGKKFKLTDKQKTAIKIGAAAVGIALAAYGGYKVYKAVKMVDVESMRRASNIVSRALGGEASKIKTSVKIASMTNQTYDTNKLRSLSNIDKLVSDTKLSEIKNGRNFKNIANATLKGIKNDVIDVRDAARTNRLSPTYDPFFTKADTNKLRRIKELNDLNNLSSSKLNAAKQSYQDAVELAYKNNRDVKVAREKAAAAANAALNLKFTSEAPKNVKASNFDIINSLNNAGVIKLNESNIEDMLANLGDKELVDKLLKNNAKKLGI